MPSRSRVTKAFEVIARRRREAVVLIVRGELDVATGARLWEAITDASGHVVIDLGECRFIDASG